MTFMIIRFCLKLWVIDVKNICKTRHDDVHDDCRIFNCLLMAKFLFNRKRICTDLTLSDDDCNIISLVTVQANKINEIYIHRLLENQNLA